MTLYHSLAQNDLECVECDVVPHSSTDGSGVNGSGGNDVCMLLQLIHAWRTMVAVHTRVLTPTSVISAPVHKAINLPMMPGSVKVGFLMSSVASEELSYNTNSAHRLVLSSLVAMLT